MPKYSDGLVTSGGQVIANSGNAALGTLSATTSTLGGLTVDSVIMHTHSLFGNMTFSRTIDFAEGPGCLAQFGNSSITVTNTGSVADVGLVALKGTALIGNGLFTVTDVSTLLISGPTTISVSPSTNSYALKVASGNSYFGGNITSSATITCNTIVANSATFTAGLSFSTPVSITDATNAMNATSGCLMLSGGIGVVKDAYIGGTVTCTTLNTSTLGLSTLNLNSLTVTGASTLAAVDLGGILKFSQRPTSIASLPYTLNFSAADAYSIITVSVAGTLTVPSGSEGQLLAIINSGSGQVNVVASIDSISTTYAVPAGGKMFLLWSLSTWRSIV